MVTNIKLSGMASAISKAIVEIVERTDGPVTLAQIEREIPGFAAEEAEAWEYYFGPPECKRVIWDGMTEAGRMALSDVITGCKVAIQFVSDLLYLTEGCLFCRDNWTPVVLLPKKAATLRIPNRLVRLSQSNRDFFAARARAKRDSYECLTPSPMRFTVDQFSVQ